MNMFEEATRKAYRFNSNKGLLSVEDLWHLPLTSARSASLDTVAKECNKELKGSEEESFVSPHSSENRELQLKLDLVKHIIQVRLQENEEARNQVAKKQKKEKIMDILAQKQDETLKDMSIEDLQSMLNEL